MSWQIAEDILDHAPDMSYREFRVLLALAHSANSQTRECWPGIEYLMLKANCSERAVYRALAGLETRGLIKRSGTAAKGHRQVYTILPMGDTSSSPIGTAQRVTLPGQRVTLKGSKGDTSSSPLPRTVTSSVISARADEQPPAAADSPVMTEMVIHELKAATGKTVSNGWAAKTARYYLNGRGVHDPVSFVRACIRREPNPRTTLLPQYGDPYADSS